MKTNSPVTGINLKSWKGGELISKEDLVVVEEPLQIRLQVGGEKDWQEKELAITMRTPGHDFDLAFGFLLAENIIQHREDIQLIRYCKRVKEEEKGNVLIVRLEPSVRFDPKLLERNFMTNSSCGICGKSAIEAVSCLESPLEPGIPTIPFSLLNNLNKLLLKEQTVFRHTGGIHATALFTSGGELLYVREDVGRHNAFDKMVGAALQENRLSLKDGIVMLSGRVSFELVQKAVRARIPILVAVGAPSSLAVSLAAEKGITLIGFLKKDSFNVYTGNERIIY